MSFSLLTGWLSRRTSGGDSAGTTGYMVFPGASSCGITALNLCPSARPGLEIALSREYFLNCTWDAKPNR
jgi:hypothetical protein